MRGRAGRGPPKRYRGLCLHHPKAPTSLARQERRPFLQPGVSRAFSLYVQASASLSSLLCASRISSSRFCGRPFSRSYAPASSLRPYGPWSASSQLSYVQAFSLQSSALNDSLVEFGRRNTQPTKNIEKYAEVVLTKQYQRPSPKTPINRKNQKPNILLCFRASSGYGRKIAG